MEDETYCYYCGEPIDDGLCSAHCHESEGDEGRECECEDIYRGIGKKRPALTIYTVRTGVVWGGPICLGSSG